MDIKVLIRSIGLAAQLLAVLFGAGGCTSTERYVVPPNLEAYSIIVAARSPEGADSVYVQHIDRKEIPFYGGNKLPAEYAAKLANVDGVRANKALLLSPEMHRIHICACDQTAGGSSYCASAVLRLNAQADKIYKATGKVSMRRDYADVWIEDALSGESVVGPVRASDLGVCPRVSFF